MGRPINKRVFGPQSSLGQQFDNIDAWIPGEAGEEKCYIVRQTGSHKFILHGKTSGNEGVCWLSDVSSGSLSESEMVMVAYPYAGGSENIKSFTQHKLRTFSGNQYTWSADSDATDENGTDIGNMPVVDFNVLNGQATVITTSTMVLNGSQINTQVGAGVFNSMGDEIRVE